ncbi:hypothetical protein TOC8171_24030 [Pseudomonas syringae]
MQSHNYVQESLRPLIVIDGVTDIRQADIKLIPESQPAVIDELTAQLSDPELQQCLLRSIQLLP